MVEFVIVFYFFSPCFKNIGKFKTDGCLCVLGIQYIFFVLFVIINNRLHHKKLKPFCFSIGLFPLNLYVLFPFEVGPVPFAAGRLRFSPGLRWAILIILISLL